MEKPLLGEKLTSMVIKTDVDEILKMLIDKKELDTYNKETENALKRHGLSKKIIYSDSFINMTKGRLHDELLEMKQREEELFNQNQKIVMYICDVAINMFEDLEKKKALETALGQIEKQFGKGSVMKLGEYQAMNVEAIPTGALSLDIALGIGGIPRGRIIEIFGPESSGKTTLALHAIAEAQKLGGEAAFIDAEHALDPVYAKHLGVDIDNLIVSQPDTGEQALEIAEALTRSGAIDIIVVDSVAALVPKAEIDGDMGDAHVGLQARLMSQALRKLAGVINKSKTVIIFINQLREKVGIMFGNPETTPGGRALKFYASVRLDIRKIENIKTDGEVTGARARVKVIKNKVAPPFREAEFDIVYGRGISKEGNILDLAVNLNLVEKAGAWFSYNGEKIGQGRENAKTYLKEHKEVAQELEEKIRENFRQAFEKSLGDEEEDQEQEVEPEE